MDYFWNDSTILPPPVNTYKCIKCDIDINKLHTVLSDAVSFLQDQEILHKEAAVISRLIYLMGRKFRHDIGHSYVKKTNLALLKYLNLNILKDLKLFLSVIPTSLTTNTYMPTCQMLEFILVRLQTFSKIMCRVVSCSKSAATFSFKRLKKGDSAWLSVIPLTVLSRIWNLSKRLLQNACKWYNNLLPYQKLLTNVGPRFLPVDYIFPDNLYKWIDDDLENEKIESHWSVNSLNNIALTNNSDNESDCSEVLNPVKNNFDIKNIMTCSPNVNNNCSNVSHVLDVGVKISRQEYLKTQQSIVSENSPIKIGKKNNLKRHVSVEDKMTEFIPSCPKQVKSLESQGQIEDSLINKGKILTQSKVKYVHSIHSVICNESFNAFMDKEEVYRMKNNKKALSTQLGFMQWQSLKSILIGIVDNIDGKPDEKKQKLLKKVRKVWNERCSN